MEVKQCADCKVYFTLDCFYTKLAAKDGLQNVCKTCKAQDSKRRYNESPESRRRAILCTIRARAKQKRLPFNIELSDIDAPETCPVFGIPLQVSYGGGYRSTDNSPSVDRIIPELGYVKGNIIVVSNKANRIKNNATTAELRLVAAFYTQLENNTNEPTATAGLSTRRNCRIGRVVPTGDRPAVAQLGDGVGQEQGLCGLPSGSVPSPERA